ncbi:CoA ester lyase [Bordetella sp. N]|uniref:HpcH/HpaI aldolase/citrate lyase family protein n=1 Tax=Bordetella sp. N TaxID=1746199 RepID=UPI0007099A43|nr:CoA ester lyase [Bordetella sp. N]ALM83431.1 host specificity protein [Bordetella sp. N]
MTQATAKDGDQDDIAQGLATVRSALFVPASRADRIPKALASGADVVIVDLEDAVEPAAKPAARQAVVDFLADPAHSDVRIWVRVNDATTPWHEDDLAALRDSSDGGGRGRRGVAGIMLPKAETAAQVAHAGRGIPVVPIIETARGLLNLAEIAAASDVARLVFGSLDYGVDLGLTPDTEGAAVLLDQARGLILLHSRAADLPAPLDGVHADISDSDGLRAMASRAGAMGFAGMLCIHPSQVEVVHAALRPAEADIAWAQRVLSAAQQNGAGAFRFEGKMVDAPVIARARQVLSRAD